MVCSPKNILYFCSMIYNEDLARQIAKNLLDIQAVVIQTDKPFTWASGWKSPVYCDNRLVLSYPEIRNTVVTGFKKIFQDHFKDTNCIAGVATAGIPHASILAHVLGLPLVYVRSSAKGHGRANRIEGKLIKGSKVLVIEDLVSTAKSCLDAVEALQEAGAEITGVAAVFDYGFDTAIQNFKKYGLKHITLSNYQILIKLAEQLNYIDKIYSPALKEWRKDPSNWNNI